MHTFQNSLRAFPEGGTGYCNMHKEYAKSGDTGGSGSAQDPVCYLGGGIDFNTKTIENVHYDVVLRESYSDLVSQKAPSARR